LQAALAREVYYLVADDVVSVTDVDKALCWGPGLRWGIMGQVLLNHLGGARAASSISSKVHQAHDRVVEVLGTRIDAGDSTQTHRWAARGGGLRARLPSLRPAR